MITGIYWGDLEFYKIKTTLSKLEILVIFLFYIFEFFIGLITYFFFKSHNFVPSSEWEIVIKRNNLEFVFIIYFVIKIFLAVVFGFDRAGGSQRNLPFSTLLHLISIDGFFSLYQFVYIKKRNFNYWFLFFLYIVMKVLQGWSGFVLSYFFMGCFFYLRDNKKFKKLILILPFVIVLGACLYKIMYPYKMMLRTGSLRFETIPFMDALLKFVTRLSPFSNACVVFEKSNDFLIAYSRLGRPYSEIIYYFNSWTPSFLYDKTFLPLNKIFNYVLTGGTAGNFDLSVSYYYLLLKIGLLDVIMYFSIVIINCFFQMMFKKLFKYSELYVDYSYITTLVFMFSGASSLLNHGTWIPEIWNLFILFFLGCFVIRRKGLDESKFYYRKSIFAYYPENTVKMEGAC